MKKLELLQDISKYWNRKPKKQFIPGKSLIPPSSPSINSDDIVTIADALLDGWFTEGKYHRLFSRELLGQISMLNCLLCNSGSSASLLAILAVAELTPRKRFIVTCASGFPTTVSPIYQADKIPIYIDIDPNNLSPDFVQLEDVVKKYGKDIAGVIFTHTLGIPHDESRVREIIGDEIYYIVDCCLVGDTNIKTICGKKKLKNIVVGDFVLTRNGYKKVLKSEMTGNRPVITKFGLTGTAEHPIITDRGVIRLDELSAYDIIWTWNEKKLCIEKKRIIDIQNLNNVNSGFIFIEKKKEHLLRCIEKFGKMFMEKSQNISLFITRMETLLIMPFLTWNVLVEENMQESILHQRQLKSLIKTWRKQENRLLSGIKVQREGAFINALQKCLGKIKRHTQKYVKFVEVNIKPIFQLAQRIVLKCVRIKAETKAVYNLKVDASPEFFAGGILVHNCDALGAKVRGRDGFFFPVGVEADIATLSFFPAHQICTGEGGAVLSSSFEIMDIMKSFSSWGRSCYCLPGQNNTCGQRFCWKERGTLPEGYDHKYIFSRLGYNLKMTELQAAMGLSQMYRLNEFTNARMKNYTYLFEGLAQYIEYLQLVIFPLDSIPSPFGFPVIVRDVAPFTARELIEHLEANKVGTRRIFAGNLKRQPAFMGQSYMTKETPNSDYLMESAFWVGCHPSLTKEMLDYMIGVFEEFINGRE